MLPLFVNLPVEEQRHQEAGDAQEYCHMEGGAEAVVFRRKLHYLPITGAPSFLYGCFYAEGNKNPALPILLDELHGYFESGSSA